MWRTTICTILALVVFSKPPPALSSGSTSRINWLNFEEAEKFRNGDRKFFIYFYADWCTYCHKLKKKTFSEAEIIDFINTHFIPVAVDTDKEKRLASRFGVRSLPDLRFLTPEGEDLARWPGYIEKDHLLLMLKYIHTESYDKMTFMEFVRQQQNQPSAVP